MNIRVTSQPPIIGVTDLLCFPFLWSLPSLGSNRLQKPGNHIFTLVLMLSSAFSSFSSLFKSTGPHIGPVGVISPRTMNCWHRKPRSRNSSVAGSSGGAESVNSDDVPRYYSESHISIQTPLQKEKPTETYVRYALHHMQHYVGAFVDSFLTASYCHNPLLVFPSTNPPYLPSYLS